MPRCPRKRVAERSGGAGRFLGRPGPSPQVAATIFFQEALAMTSVFDARFGPRVYWLRPLVHGEVAVAREAPTGVLFVDASLQALRSTIGHLPLRLVRALPGNCLHPPDPETAHSSGPRIALGSGRIIRARWVLTWKLIPPEDLADAVEDARDNPKTVHTADGKRKAKARIALLGLEHPDAPQPPLPDDLSARLGARRS